MNSKEDMGLRIERIIESYFCHGDGYSDKDVSEAIGDMSDLDCLKIAQKINKREYDELGRFLCDCVESYWEKRYEAAALEEIEAEDRLHEETKAREAYFEQHTEECFY